MQEELAKLISPDVRFDYQILESSTAKPHDDDAVASHMLFVSSACSVTRETLWLNSEYLRTSQIWALCINDLGMAMLFWKRGRDHISNALIATCILRNLSEHYVSRIALPKYTLSHFSFYPNRRLLLPGLLMIARR
jgi:hypothetical protein